MFFPREVIIFIFVVFLLDSLYLYIVKTQLSMCITWKTSFLMMFLL